MSRLGTGTLPLRYSRARLKVRAASQTQNTTAVGVLNPEQPPAWAARLVEQNAGRLQLCTASIAAATALHTEALADAVATAYRSIARDLTRQGRFPIRIWNFVPDIQAPMSCGDRYMAFNRGRFAAYAEWFEQAGTFSTAMPTASGVGVGGHTLWIHVLSAETPGVAVENPRQIPAYRYSERYGLRPPCFARATQFEDLLLIGGTASIIGEDSQHIGDVASQSRETFLNLAALISAASDRPRPDPLRRILDLRVHVAKSSDARVVASVVEEFAPDCCDVEFVEAQLCRSDLLVEIEGRAACR